MLQYCQIMENNVFKIYHEDSDYAMAAASVFAGLLRHTRVVVCENPDEEGVFIMKGYKSAREFLRIAGREHVMPCLDCSREDSKVTGFTSGAGGTGTTSAAVCYGRILSRMEGRNVLYVSFDVMSSKCAPSLGSDREELYDFFFGTEEDHIKAPVVQDEYGLKYLKLAPRINDLMLLEPDRLSFMLAGLSEEYDRIILDIPVRGIMSFFLYGECGRLVMCYGWQPERYYASEDLKSYVEELGLAEITDFRPMKDTDPSDIHGQFGAEVRALAESIEQR